MSPLLAILRLCMEQYANLTEEQIRELLTTALKTNKAEKNTLAVRSPRRTVLKPVKVAACTFMRNGKRVHRKAHVRTKPDRRE